MHHLQGKPSTTVPQLRILVREPQLRSPEAHRYPTTRVRLQENVNVRTT